MTNATAKYAILHRGKPIAWFVRRKDANEMLGQLQWETTQGIYAMAKIA